ncbi:MAG: hypothetical protein AAB381_01295 [Patescibacteria group bacterium]
MNTPYIQHEGKVVQTDSTFTHVMAIALDPRTDHQEGVIRCITSREGDVSVSGYVDRSELHKIKKNAQGSFEIGERLEIKHEAEVTESLKGNLDFIGLEDPDIWVDHASGFLHLYFTLPLIDHAHHSKNKIHLGHAVGRDLDSLEMTEPTLLADSIGGAKELSVAPVNTNGIRLNLVESSKKESDFTYSVVRLAVAEDMGKPWKFGGILFHPKEHAIPWIGGHASPGPLFSREFIDIGEGRLVGIMNGREANKKVGTQTLYGIFSVGLFIYNYEKGIIEWVSPEPFIRDTEARTITFASQFVQTTKDEGVLYAHVDDSFVRAYTLNAEGVRDMLPV